MKPKLIGKNASIELLAGDMIYETTLTAKNIWGGHTSVDQYYFDFFLKAILIRGVNTTANGSFFLNLQAVDYFGANPTSVMNTTKVYGQEVSHLFIPGFSQRTNTEMLKWEEFDQKIMNNSGSMQARIDNSSTFTGEITVSFIYTRDNNYEY